MITLKYFPKEMTESRKKSWLKVRKKFKKIFHTKLRRGEMDKPYSEGEQEAW